MKLYQRCTRCVMDNTADEMIIFDDCGVCNYCKKAYNLLDSTYFPNKIGKEKLIKLLYEVKNEGNGKKYDCIMGISGGLDSSYLCYLGYTWGLRVLLVHVDDGFDTDISKENIEKLVKKTGFDYKVINPDVVQYNDLIKSYLKAGVPNVTAPQDNILFACLYKYMRKYKIRYFLSGGNFAQESILQLGNSHSASDIVNIKDIHSKFGNERIDKLPLLSTRQKLFDNKILKIESPRPLNYIDYQRDKAFKELNDFCGFQYYGAKHLENILTAFVQLYWLPKKFGVDKRTSHFSSMIVSGQISRDEALTQLMQPLYNPDLMNGYISIIKNKLKISDIEFEKIMDAPIHKHTYFKTEKELKIIKLIVFIKNILNKRKHNKKEIIR